MIIAPGLHQGSFKNGSKWWVTKAFCAPLCCYPTNCQADIRIYYLLAMLSPSLKFWPTWQDFGGCGFFNLRFTWGTWEDWIDWLVYKNWFSYWYFGLSGSNPSQLLFAFIGHSFLRSVAGLIKENGLTMATWLGNSIAGQELEYEREIGRPYYWCSVTIIKEKEL